MRSAMAPIPGLPLSWMLPRQYPVEEIRDVPVIHRQPKPFPALPRHAKKERHL